jgi:hypothetical protein
MHLVRVALDRDDVTHTEVCGLPGGVVANPPCIDAARGVAVGFDSGHGVLDAWRIADGADLEPLWRHDQDHGGHMIQFPQSGQLLSYDYDLARGIDQAVVRDIETGDELARVDTESPVQCVVFPSDGWRGDAYVCTFATVTRLFTE